MTILDESDNCDEESMETQSTNMTEEMKSPELYMQVAASKRDNCDDNCDEESMITVMKNV